MADQRHWNKSLTAAIYGHTEIVKLLLASGAHVNTKSNNGHIVLKNIELLKQAGAKK